jgi:hypothetical protein
MLPNSGAKMWKIARKVVVVAALYASCVINFSCVRLTKVPDEPPETTPPKSTIFDTAIYLSPDGNDAGDGLSWGTAIKTPQEALKKAISQRGETKNLLLLMKSGDFPAQENDAIFDFSVLADISDTIDSVSIIGSMQGTETKDAIESVLAQPLPTPLTTLNGQNKSYHVVIGELGQVEALRIELRRLRISGGNGVCTDVADRMQCEGAGIKIDFSGALEIRECEIKGNKGKLRGGGGYISAQKIKIVSSRIADNESHHGGGLHLTGPITSILIQDSIFSNNRARKSNLPTNSITQDQANAGKGGAMSIAHGNFPLKIESSKFSTNIGEEMASSMYVDSAQSGSTFVDLSQCDFTKESGTIFISAFGMEPDRKQTIIDSNKGITLANISEAG